MRNDFYPEGTAEKLLQTDFISPQTKKVFLDRLHTPAVSDPVFFSKEHFATLQAVSKRMLPQPEDRKNKIDIAGILDTNFAKKKPGNGWRYDNMPPDEEAMKNGLQAIEAFSQSQYSKAFTELTETRQDDLLQMIQNGETEDSIWEKIPPDKFFEELFSSLAEIYYSHPIGRDEIGDVSYADTKGWQQVNLNERDEKESAALDKTDKEN